jgi:DNA-binding NtrC family response regulator
MAISDAVSGAGDKAGMMPELPKGSQILIVGDDENAEQLVANLQKAGIGSRTAKNMTEACECVRSGDFQAVLSKPMLIDGSWRRLIDVANHYDLGFEVVLVARDFGHAAWSEALDEGVFDVLDTLSNQPGAAEVTRRALWAAYLKGAGPKPARTSSPQKAA